MALNQKWMIKYHRQGISTFVETGFYMGETVTNALNSKLFEKIYSIELSPVYFKRGVEIYRSRPSVELIEGDSTDVFPNVLSTLNLNTQRAMFWLDAHYSAGNTSRGKKISPIVEELLALVQHPIKNNTIFIDDMRYMTNAEGFHGVTVKELEALIKSINRDYEIDFIDPYAINKGISEPQILVATTKD